MIDIPEMGDDSHSMWNLLLEMQAELDVEWTLIGAQNGLRHIERRGADPAHLATCALLGQIG